MRRTHHIRRQQATNFKPAIRLAERIGAPLNQFVTINLTHLDCNAENVSKVFAQLRDGRFTPWARRPGKAFKGNIAPTAFIWVIENKNGHVAVHWLVHVEPTRLADFKKRLPKWLKQMTGSEGFPNTVDVKEAYGPFGAAKYMLKGIDPMYARFYGIRPDEQGLVYGKRCGFSASLGKSRCREARTYGRQIWHDRKAAEAASGVSA